MINVRDFGALGDGLSHKVSTVYPDWQVRFPHATSPDDELDWCAIQAAIDAVPIEGDTVFLPPGQYVAGDILIRKPIIFEGSWAPRNADILSSILVPPEKRGIFVRHFLEEVKDDDGNVVTFRDLNPTGAIVRNLNILPQRAAEGAPALLPTKDGIYVFGANGFKIENVYVGHLGGNGIHIYGPGTDPDNTPPIAPLAAYFNCNNWQIENCAVYACAENGLLVEGGDVNAGLCASLDVTGNLGWGICERSFLGNTYVACHASSNQLGSYLVYEAANYSSFFGCYQEGDNLPDLNRSPGILVAGGNLAYDHRRIVTNAENQIEQVDRLSSEDRLGYTWSRLNFQEQLPLRKEVPFDEIPGGWVPDPGEPVPGDERTLGVTIPNLVYDSDAAALTFTYDPTIAGRQVWRNGQFEPDRPQLPDGTFAKSWNKSSWLLARYTQDYTNEANYDPNYPDRTWVIKGSQNEVDPFVIPFGWTDRQHPLGPGHLFFWNPLANQRAHWTKRQEITQDIPPGGMWVDGQRQAWLNKDQREGASVLALFSLEARLADPAESSPLSIGPYQIFDDGSFKVWVANHSGATISPGAAQREFTLVSHFEIYLEWPGA